MLCDRVQRFKGRFLYARLPVTAVGLSWQDEDYCDRLRMLGDDGRVRVLVHR
jgi:hypothetical protein